MPYSVYILQSNKTGKFYIGSSNDPVSRLVEHNYGKNRFTKGQRPWRLVFQEIHQDRTAARKRENKIKSWKSKVAVENLVRNRKEVLGSPDGIGIPISS